MYRKERKKKEGKGRMRLEGRKEGRKGNEGKEN